jgi:hypothetical protein
VDINLSIEHRTSLGILSLRTHSIAGGPFVSRYTIDRFDGNNWVVLEDETARTFTVPRSWVPSGAREGDVVKTLRAADDTSTTTIRFELDPEARDEQRANARARRNALPRGPKGDISL